MFTSIHTFASRTFTCMSWLIIVVLFFLSFLFVTPFTPDSSISSWTRRSSRRRRWRRWTSRKPRSTKSKLSRPWIQNIPSATPTTRLAERSTATTTWTDSGQSSSSDLTSMSTGSGTTTRNAAESSARTRMLSSSAAGALISCPLSSWTMGPGNKKKNNKASNFGPHVNFVNFFQEGLSYHHNASYRKMKRMKVKEKTLVLQIRLCIFLVPSKPLTLDLMKTLDHFFRRACYHWNASYRKMKRIQVVENL